MQKKQKILANIFTIRRCYFFPILKYLFEKPLNINFSYENLTKFSYNYQIDTSFYFNKKLTVQLRTDQYNICRGIYPKYDFFRRKIYYKYFDIACKKIMDSIVTNKTYKVYSSKHLYNLVRLFRKQHPILKSYLNLYLVIYSLGTDNLQLLSSIKFISSIKNILYKNFIKKLDVKYYDHFRKRKINNLNILISFTLYLYFQDVLFLNKRIKCFNLRNSGFKMTKYAINDFKKVNMDVLAYSILRQKLRVHLILITLCSLLNIKKRLRTK